MARGERLPSALLKEALLPLVPLEREVERYPSIQEEQRTVNQEECTEHHAFVQIPITEITKRVDRQHI